MEHGAGIQIKPELLWEPDEPSAVDPFSLIFQNVKEEENHDCGSRYTEESQVMTPQMHYHNSVDPNYGGMKFGAAWEAPAADGLSMIQSNPQTFSYNPIKSETPWMGDVGGSGQSLAFENAARFEETSLLSLDSVKSSTPNTAKFVVPTTTENQWMENSNSSEPGADMFLEGGDHPYICNICQKTFAEQWKLSRHMLIHETDRPFECETCHKGFTERWNLQRHMLTHEGESSKDQPYSCERCEKKFIDRSSLKSHELMHSDDPYICNICDKNFRHAETRNRHIILVHMKGSRYSCTACGESFNVRSDLRKHMSTHEGNQLYTCPVCSKTFNARRSLTRHSAVHANERS